MTSTVGLEGGPRNRFGGTMFLKQGFDTPGPTPVLEGRPSALVESVDVSVLVSGSNKAETDHNGCHVIGTV